MGRKAAIWYADDGTPFNDEASMLLHEMAILDAKEIDLFLASSEFSGKRKTEYRKLLINWQQYMRKQYPVATDNIPEEHVPSTKQPAWKPAGYAFKDELPFEDDIDPFANATSI